MPPLLWKSIRQIRNSLKSKAPNYIEWEYIPEGWQKQNQDSNIKGWNIESVLEAYKANWPTFIKNLETTLPFHKKVPILCFITLSSPMAMFWL